MSQILKKFTTIRVEGTKRFVVKDGLVRANIGWTGLNFNKLFLDVIEEDIEATTLTIHSLVKASHDDSIISELGEHAKIKLAYFFGLLEKQSKGEAGPLLVSKYGNVAYITDVGGTIWTLGACWSTHHGYWYMEAFSTECPIIWSIREQVLSLDCG